MQYEDGGLRKKRAPDYYSIRFANRELVIIPADRPILPPADVQLLLPWRVGHAGLRNIIYPKHWIAISRIGL
jgi:hypothetical protein